MRLHMLRFAVGWNKLRAVPAVERRNLFAIAGTARRLFQPTRMFMENFTVSHRQFALR